MAYYERIVVHLAPMAQVILFANEENIRSLSALQEVMEHKVESLTTRKKLSSSSLQVLRMEHENGEKRIGLMTEKRSTLTSKVHLLRFMLT
jgi:hypothetical protein